MAARVTRIMTPAPPLAYAVRLSIWCAATVIVVVPVAAAAAAELSQAGAGQQAARLSGSRTRARTARSVSCSPVLNSLTLGRTSTR